MFSDRDVFGRVVGPEKGTVILISHLKFGQGSATCYSISSYRFFEQPIKCNFESSTNQPIHSNTL